MHAQADVEHCCLLVLFIKPTYPAVQVHTETIPKRQSLPGCRITINTNDPLAGLFLAVFFNIDLGLYYPKTRLKRPRNNYCP